jgi:hypothetical protein
MTLTTTALLSLALCATASRADDTGIPQRIAAVEAAAEVEGPPEKKRFQRRSRWWPRFRRHLPPGRVAGPAVVGHEGGGAADNVFRTLQTLPGIAATTEFDSRLSVRGGSPDENLTIMDGVEIHNPYRLFGLTSAFNPETVRSFDLYAGAFSSKYGDRLSSLLVVENRPGNDEVRLGGSTALSLTDANAVFEGSLPGEGKGSWIVTGRRTYYDLVANSLVDTELPAFGDLQGRLDWNLKRGPGSPSSAC